MSALECGLNIRACPGQGRGPNDGIFIHPFGRETCPTGYALAWKRLRLRPTSVARLRRIYSDSIAMARRLGNDEETCVLAAAIEDLMRHLRGHSQPREGRETVILTVQFDGELAVEDVEELRRALVQVALLCGPRRHAFFYHAERFRTMKMPAIARLRAGGAGPGVVLGGRSAHGLHGKISPSEVKRTAYTRHGNTTVDGARLLQSRVN
jgi:hypothetical protein